MEPASRQISLYNRRTAIMGVVLMGAVLAVWSYRDSRQRDHDRAEAEFARRATIRHTLTREVLGRYEDALFGLTALFMLGADISPAEFNRSARRLEEHTPGALAIEWVPFVPAAERAGLEAALADHYRPHPFEFIERDAAGNSRRAGDRPAYLPICYIYPRTGNERAFGYDLLTGPTRSSLDQARANGKLTLTGQVHLVQEPADRLGIIMAMPAFRPGTDGSPPVFAGFVQMVFRTHDLLERTRTIHPDTMLDMFFLDASETDPALRLLYYRPAVDQAQPLSVPTEAEFRQGVSREQTIPIGRRDWRVLYRPRAGWFEEQNTTLPWVRTGGVIMITLLLTGLVHTLGRRTENIEREVAARTDELRRTQQLLREDIRRRTETERALKASERRMQDILDHSPNSIFVKDLEGKYVLVNRQYERMWGRTGEEIRGRNDAGLFPPEVAAAHRTTDQQALDAGDVIKFEVTVDLPTGTPATTHLVHKFPLRDAEGRIYGLCGISTDITDRKQAEADKLAFERNLLQTQKLESLGVLAGGIAHDFNNILTSVLGNASLARQVLAPDEASQKYLHQIENAARRAAALCAHMLTYAGKGKLAANRTDLNRLVQDTCSLLKVSIDKNCSLHLVPASDLPPVLADATQLRQIVMNLIINGAEAIDPRAGGLITVTTFTVQAEAALFHTAIHQPKLPPGPYVGLEVRDNGAGMAPETIARIFEPFFTTKFSGRGLGLSAVLGIIQGHQAALFVTSQPGQGSTFRLLLPAAEGEAVSSQPPFPDPDNPVRLQGTVLVIDDEEAICVLATAVMECHGAQALSATSGTEALELLRTQGEKISLILLDMTMPGLTGEDTLRQLRQLGFPQPVILMSGYSEKENMQRSANLGVAGFVQKPFEVKSLLAKIRPFLS